MSTRNESASWQGLKVGDYVIVTSIDEELSSICQHHRVGVLGGIVDGFARLVWYHNLGMDVYVRQGDYFHVDHWLIERITKEDAECMIAMSNLSGDTTRCGT